MEQNNRQQTIRKETLIKGVGLHTGRKCRALFKPAPENSGIKFIRVDLPGRPVLEATLKNVVDIIRGTTLGINDEVRVYTIEHVLSALNGLQIDNLTIELDDNEPPVADGSAQEFVKALRECGVVEQNAQKNILKIETPLEYTANQTLIRIDPSDTFEIDCEITYDHPMIKQQRFVFRRGDDYPKEIAPARTFCFDYEIEALKKKGLAKGGSLDNAIVIGPDGIYNPEFKLRFDNEFVRHKTLDLMGDLMLLGQPLQGKITAKRCGHGHNIKFIEKLMEQLRGE